jgi:hypothetical protein
MDVKPPNIQIPIAVPAQYQRTITLLQRAFLPSTTVYPDDVVDCVELKTGKTLLEKRLIINYKPADGPRTKNKGQIIDTWI